MKMLLLRWLLAALWVGLSAHLVAAQGPMLDPSFAPTSAQGRPSPPWSPGTYAPYIDDMLLQPDGKFVVVGDFISINGRPAICIARLLPDGNIDTTFHAPVPDSTISAIVRQADGKLVIGGSFKTVGGQSRVGIARLLPDGSLDPSFLSPLGNNPPPFASGTVSKIVAQPGRGLLVFGNIIPISSTGMRPVSLARLLEATGALDPTFQPAFNTLATFDVLVQPSGHLVFAGRPRLINGQPCLTWGTLPDGALDPAFVPLPSTDPLSQATRLARDPAAGHLYVVRGPMSTGLEYAPVRLLPNGVLDPSFSTAGMFPTAGVSGPTSMVVQPNGRLLLGGGFPTVGGGFFGSARLLPSGTLDPSYAPSYGPNSGVAKVLVQPDGALVFAGIFQEVAGLPVQCLTRLLDPNVLGTRVPASLDVEVTAWPVPAREVLHLSLSATRPAQELALLDALGRVVRQQALPAGQFTSTLPTAGLPPGAYLLRVAFAQGPPAYRRVLVE